MVSPSAPNDKCYKLTLRANELFERNLFSEAIIEYTKALKSATEVCDDDYLALIYSNRSASFLQTNDLEKAKEDASRAVTLAKHWAKVRIILKKKKDFDNLTKKGSLGIFSMGTSSFKTIKI